MAVGHLVRLVGLCYALGVTALASNGTDDASLFWGTYRPNLYFGLRPQVPLSLMTGLMWFGTQDYTSFNQIRHSCEEGDELAGYTWTEHDIREGGVQILKDPKNNVQITTELLKFPGGEHGGSWAVRINGKPMDLTQALKASMVFYAGLEGVGSLNLDTENYAEGVKGDVELSGSSNELGDFKLRFVDDVKSQLVSDGRHISDFARRAGKTHVIGRALPENIVWRAKDLIAKSIIDFAQPKVEKYKESGLPEPGLLLSLADDVTFNSNFYAIQKSFEGEFSFDVYFESGSAEHALDATLLSRGIETFKQGFHHRFRETFPLPPGASPERVAFSEAITSNLFGGVGYFYGTSIVDGSGQDEADDVVSDDDDEDDSEEVDAADDPKIKARAKKTIAPPRSLLTATPSRSFFPRGFYWDEGFHLLHIGEWDNDFSLAILKSWVGLIDENGWVGREQILGEEARSKVPEEFQMQFPNYANPPTLTMAVTAFIDRLRRSTKGDPMGDQLGLQGVPQGILEHEQSKSSSLLEPQAAREYLQSIYPALRRHYDWFRRTQRGEIKQWAGRRARSRTEGYRWRGRSKEHVLTSGLDDYPRAKPHVGELHIDLISWVAFFTRTMREIAEFLEVAEDVQELAGIEQAILGNIDDLHWNEEEQLFCDATVDDDDDSMLVCHRGYVSLFPFLLGLLPADSPKLKPILDLVRDPNHLWSPYGIRSLSASHPQFGTGENYWKGAVWIQMNYLALRSLHRIYATQPGPYQSQARTIYQELRKNVVDNVFKEYERTGYVWEQYDALTGEGRRSHPFTGWTSLVTLIISEKY